MIEALLAELQAAQAAQWLRSARWGYAGVNGAHILGIAMLVGAILPLDLRLLGFWRAVPVPLMARVLVPVAATGLLLAGVMGVALFAIRAQDYAALDIFRIKLLLVLVGAGAALVLHLRAGWWLQHATTGTLRRHAVLSLGCWLGALACGRLIAFVM